MAFLGRTQRKSPMLVVRGRVEMEMRMGAGVLKGINLSANAVGLKSFGFLSFGLVCGSAKKTWFWPVVAAKEEPVECWFLGASES